MRPSITLLSETNIEASKNGQKSLGGAPFRNNGRIVRLLWPNKVSKLSEKAY